MSTGWKPHRAWCSWTGGLSGLRAGRADGDQLLARGCCSAPTVEGRWRPVVGFGRLAVPHLLPYRQYALGASGRPFCACHTAAPARRAALALGEAHQPAAPRWKPKFWRKRRCCWIDRSLGLKPTTMHRRPPPASLTTVPVQNRAMSLDSPGETPPSPLPPSAAAAVQRALSSGEPGIVAGDADAGRRHPGPPPTDATALDVAVRTLFRLAITGNPKAFALIADRIEGRVGLRSDDGSPMIRPSASACRPPSSRWCASWPSARRTRLPWARTTRWRTIRDERARS